jgi:KDO2-lipid IV(A) lauroyltransferase
MDARAHDGLFWRRLAHLGASRGPEWWVRYSPPFFGLAAALLVPGARRAVRDNLRRVRGRRAPLREALDVAHTFTSYAGCLAEVLASGSKNARLPDATVGGQEHLAAVIARRAGFVVATAHTAGWDVVGPLLTRDHGVEVMIVMAPERAADARALHDAARRASGVRVAHVGDPVAALSILHHVRDGGVVALQLDRIAPGMRARQVCLFGGPARVPEGPLRLAQVTGAPILPAFTARTGYRSYHIEICEPLLVPRRASQEELDRTAQRLADAMQRFLEAHPTQWFRFQEE